MRMLLQNVLQWFNRTTQSLSADFYDGLIERYPAVKRRRRSDRAVAPDLAVSTISPVLSGMTSETTASMAKIDIGDGVANILRVGP
ncbi:MAG: hypothetical protein WB036_12035 [Pseudolabrys sp.]